MDERELPQSLPAILLIAFRCAVVRLMTLATCVCQRRPLSNVSPRNRWVRTLLMAEVPSEMLRGRLLLFFPGKTIAAVFEGDMLRPRVCKNMAILETAAWRMQFTFRGLEPESQTQMSSAYIERWTGIDLKEEGSAAKAMENSKGDSTLPCGTPPDIGRMSLSACPIRTWRDRLCRKPCRNL